MTVFTVFHGISNALEILLYPSPDWYLFNNEIPLMLWTLSEEHGFCHRMWLRKCQERPTSIAELYLGFLRGTLNDGITYYCITSTPTHGCPHPRPIHGRQRRQQPPHRSLEEWSSTKPVPGIKKVGDHCHNPPNYYWSMWWQTTILFASSYSAIFSKKTT